MEVVDILSRWVHVGTAIVLVGGTVFTRFVLIPAAEKTLPDDAHAALRERVISTWKKFVMGGIALLLLSGFYNYIAVGIDRHEGDGLYHMLMGVKMMLAVGVFFLASALVGRSPALEMFRRDAKKWLAVTILLAAAVVAIGGYLKVRGVPPAKPAPAIDGTAGTKQIPARAVVVPARPA